MKATVVGNNSGEFAFARGMTGVRRGWFIHAVVYSAVNLGLATLALLHGRTPILAVALAWGVGLAVHGAVALAVGGRRHLRGNDD